MSCYQTMLRNLNKVLTEDNQLPYNDSIIVGDNSSGKSEILLVLASENAADYYFIDAVNRFFDVGQVKSDLSEKIVYSPEISKFRLEENHFNLEDSFYYKGIPRGAEDFYTAYAKKIDDLMSKFFDIRFAVHKNELGDWMASSNGKEIKLSSGYQAVLRLILELVYLEEVKGEAAVIIDEIEEYLSAQNGRKIFRFIREKFFKFHYVITTHSADLIADTEQANLIALHGAEFEVMDAGDFSSVSQVYNLFDKIFASDTAGISIKKKIDEQLRMLFNNRTAGIWGENEKEKLYNLQREELSKAQKVLLRRIEGW